MSAMPPVRPSVDADPGEYDVVATLGTGAFGVVFHATDPGSGRSVALKRLSCRHLLDPESHRHFAREAAMLARIDHPGVVRLVSHGRRDGFPYVVTEYIDGRTLEALLADEGPLAVERAVELTAQVLRALEAVHAAGVVHRDLKPSNVMVSVDANGRERIVLVDFGGAALIGDVEQCSEVVGTPQYMAPEQVFGGTDGRADIFAVGALLFEMLTGGKAFPTRTIRTLLARADVEPPPAFDLDGPVPAQLRTVVRRALAGQPAWRYRSASAMLRALGVRRTVRRAAADEDGLPVEPVEAPMARAPSVVSAPVETAVVVAETLDGSAASRESWWAAGRRWFASWYRTDTPRSADRLRRSA